MFKQTAGASTPTASSRFNPSVGILGVQASQTGVHPPLRIRFNPSVGILGVQASRKPPSATERAGFNPSVGILGVQAAVMMSRQAGKNEFQSLGRDSGCSSRLPPMLPHPRPLVSIPRSGFWVFKHFMSRLLQYKICSFNPSVGILGVQA